MAKHAELCFFGLALSLALASCEAVKGSPSAAPAPQKSAFQKQLDARNVKVLEEHGDVVNFEELKAHYAPQEPDSTPLYKEAHALLPKGIQDEMMVTRTADPVSGPALVNRLVAQNAKALELVDKAAEMKRPALEIEGLTGWKDPEEVYWLFDLGRLMGERARQKITNGDLDGFVADYRKLDNIAYHAAEYKDYKGASTLSNLGRRGLFTPLIDRYRDDKATLLKVQEFLESRRATPTPFDGLHGKAANCVYLLEDEARLKKKLQFEYGNDNSAYLDQQIEKGILGQETRLAAADECVRRVAEMWQVSDRLQGRRYNYFEVQDEFYLQHLEIIQDVNPTAQLVNILLQVPIEYHREIANIYVRNKTARILVRLALLRLENGQWPDELPDWGDLTQDPFSDGMLKYKRTNPGFILYSVGYDGIDNGGSSMSKELVGDLASRLRFD